MISKSSNEQAVPKSVKVKAVRRVPVIFDTFHVVKNVLQDAKECSLVPDKKEVLARILHSWQWEFGKVDPERISRAVAVLCSEDV